MVFLLSPTAPGGTINILPVRHRPRRPGGVFSFNLVHPVPAAEREHHAHFSFGVVPTRAARSSSPLLAPPLQAGGGFTSSSLVPLRRPGGNERHILISPRPASRAAHFASILAHPDPGTRQERLMRPHPLPPRGRGGGFTSFSLVSPPGTGRRLELHPRSSRFGYRAGTKDLDFILAPPPPLRRSGAVVSSHPSNRTRP